MSSPTTAMSAGSRPGAGGDTPRRSSVIHRDRAASPDGVDGEVPGDRQQPGRDVSAASVEGRRVAPGSQQRFLRDVLGGTGLAHDGEGQSEDPTLEPLDEGGRGVRVRQPEASEQRGVRPFVRRERVDRLQCAVRAGSEGGGHCETISSVDVSLRSVP